MVSPQAISAGLEVVGSLSQLFGYMSSGRAARMDGARQRVAAEFAAVQDDRDASETAAASQRLALEEQRKGRHEASRALAVAAASGGGASDPTIINLLANVKGEAAYRSSVALYEGESKARKLRLQAIAARLGGQAAYGEGRVMGDAYDLAGTGALVKGAGGLYAKYGMSASTPSDGVTASGNYSNQG